MTPCIVTQLGEVIYEAIDCDDAFNELRKWFMAHIDEINTMPNDKKLMVVDIDSERLIKKDEKGYYLESL